MTAKGAVCQLFLNLSYAIVLIAGGVFVCAALADSVHDLGCHRNWGASAVLETISNREEDVNTILLQVGLVLRALVTAVILMTGFCSGYLWKI